MKYLKLFESYESYDESSLGDFLAELDDICQELVDNHFEIEYETLYFTNRGSDILHNFKNGEEKLSRILMYISKPSESDIVHHSYNKKFFLIDVKEYIIRVQKYLEQKGYPSTVYLDRPKYTIDLDNIIEYTPKEGINDTLLTFKQEKPNQDDILINSPMERAVIDIRFTKEKGVSIS